MSTISHLLIRRVTLLTRPQHLNPVRQALAPFSTSHRALADKAETGDAASTQSGKSFDSVPIHLGPLGKVVMVLGGLYSRLGDVPDSIPNRAYQKAKDKFRARCVVFSLFGTGMLAFVAATRGRKARDEGKRYTDDVYRLHRGESRVHDQLEAKHRHRKSEERYSSENGDAQK